VSGLGTRPVATAPAGAHGVDAAAVPTTSAPASALRASLLRLVAFAGLAMFGAAHWAPLVDSPPVGRTLLVVLVATGTGGVLILLGTPAVRAALGPRFGGPLVVLLGLVVSVIGLALALAAIGLPVRLLAPGNWNELVDGLDRGLAGIQSIEWPYSGEDEWVRRTILLGAPFMIAVAAALAFFPFRPAASALHAAGLGVLLAVYITAVSEYDPGEPLLRGLVLLVLVAAWLWLPRLGSRDALAGAGLVLSLGVLSLPVAAALDSDRPWWDYRAWTWLGNGKTITFDWTHSYGPLNWPREGTTLLNVKADRAHYWKAETLDTFDGVRWTRGRLANLGYAGRDVPDIGPGEDGWTYFERNPRWDEQIRFTVRSLSTNLVVGAGTTYDVDGIGWTRIAPDGTTGAARRLEEGDSYTIRTYAPNPTPAQMRGAPDGMSLALAEYTLIGLPRQVEDLVRVPLWGSSTNFGDPEAPRQALEESVYGDMYGIATRVAAGAPTMYDAVNRIDRYLQRTYTYSEKTPRAEYPLNAFLFRDKFGYCQQFSGTMTLMLRMLGIPARVAAGFAPGSLNRDTNEYRVRDLDAHSWVEVYFNGIGWVTFDPTPAAAPAEREDANLPISAAGGAINGSRAGVAAPDRGSGSSSAATPEDGSGASPWLLLPLVLLAAGGLVAVQLNRRARRLTPEQRAEAQLAELPRALGRLGWELPAQTTLLGLEKRLGRIAGPSAAGYAARLRAHRYDPRSPEAPSLHDRRQLRRDLTARSGLRGRLLGLIAIPPGGPKPV
jgi:protein-glutamine gamma-glutamyltransferase